MHKSAMLRYFETREQIFLILTARGWRDWSTDIRAQSAESRPPRRRIRRSRIERVTRQQAGLL